MSECGTCVGDSRGKGRLLIRLCLTYVEARIVTTCCSIPPSPPLRVRAADAPLPLKSAHGQQQQLPVA